MPADVLGLVSRQFARDRFRYRGFIEALSGLSLKCTQSGFVECLHGLLLDLVAECVGIVFHPREQRGARWIRTARRPWLGLDPGAYDVGRNLAKPAAGVVQFVSLCRTARQESLV